jgi:TatD DNase family protein
VIDSHCHLADAAFADDLEEVVVRAREAGLTHTLVILGAGDTSERTQAVRLTNLWSGVRLAAGVHPHQAHDAAEPGRATALVREAFTAEPLVRAVGEIGLDYHYDLSPPETQRRVFAEQVVLARELRRPVIIHTREAEEDTFEILEREGGGDVTGVFHCFTGDTAMARRALDLGFSLSFAGIVTFPKASNVREAAALVPDDRLLVETDSPFLAPVPHRGKRNEPAFVARVIETLADLRATPPAALDALTTANFLRLVGETEKMGSG